MRQRCFVVLLITFPLSVAFAANWGDDSPASVDEHLRSHPITLHAPTSRPAALVEGTFNQSIDHTGQLPGQTFAQRYWIDSEYASSADTAPVIFHICGEGDAEQGYFLDDNAIAWAQTLGAHLVYLEHRYYGQSLPFPDLATDHLKYLTMTNVIEDLAAFQKWIVATQGWKGKWVSVGGSYSGTVSAIYRLLHPELISGALASSAPMISGEDQPEDDPGDADDLSSTDPSSDTGDRQWAYEACSIFGFWQTDGDTIYDPSSALCQQVFGNIDLVNSTSYNQRYYNPFIANGSGAASNILFTYGTDDIWTTIGVSPQTNLNSNITILLIQGAGHHFDLNAPDPSDSSEVLAARSEFVTLAKKWLTD